MLRLAAITISLLIFGENHIKTQFFKCAVSRLYVDSTTTTSCVTHSMLIGIETYSSQLRNKTDFINRFKLNISSPFFDQFLKLKMQSTFTVKVKLVKKAGNHNN